MTTSELRLETTNMIAHGALTLAIYGQLEDGPAWARWALAIVASIIIGALFGVVTMAIQAACRAWARWWLGKGDLEP